MRIAASLLVKVAAESNQLTYSIAEEGSFGIEVIEAVLL